VREVYTETSVRFGGSSTTDGAQRSEEIENDWSVVT
jgi:hypothetical protein